MAECVRPSTNASSGLPTEIRFSEQQLPSGKKATIPVYTYEQLEQWSVMALKNKAKSLQETIGESALPPISGGSQTYLMRWIMDVQISLCATIGLRVNFQNFGAPADFDSSDDKGYFGGDGAMPHLANNFIEADSRKPLHLVQPAHRNLTQEDSIAINQQEAAVGFAAARRRNAGSVQLG